MRVLLLVNFRISNSSTAVACACKLARTVICSSKRRTTFFYVLYKMLVSMCQKDNYLCMALFSISAAHVMGDATACIAACI